MKWELIIFQGLLFGIPWLAWEVVGWGHVVPGLFINQDALKQDDDPRSSWKSQAESLS